MREFLMRQSFQTSSRPWSATSFPPIFSPGEARASLEPRRLEAIRAALRGNRVAGDIEIRYYCPWFDPAVIQNESTDMVFSQFVLKHVDDLESTYAGSRNG